MGARRQIAGWVLLGLFGCWGALRALEQGAAQGQTGKVAQPVQFTPQSPEPPLAAPPPTPPPPMQPLVGAPLILGSVCPLDPPTPVVSLSVRVNACASADQELEYHICIKNDSAAAAHHVLVRNPIPANARFVRATPAPNVTDSELRWHFGTLGPCACREIVLVLCPTCAEDVKNCARVQFEHGQSVTTRLVRAAPLLTEPPLLQPPEVKPPQVAPPEVKPLPPGGKKTTEPPLPPGGKKTIEPPLILEEGDRAKLELSIDGPKAQYAGPTTRYRLTVRNTGKAAATNVLLAALLPAGTTYLRASDEAKLVKNQVAWLLGTLPVGQSRTVEVFLRANQAGELCVRARALADREVRAEAEFCTKFQGVSALSLEMIDRDDPIAVGGRTSYPIQVVNQGTAPVKNLRVQVTVPPQLLATRAVGASAPPEKLPAATAEGVTFQFAPLPTLAPGTKAEYEVFVQARTPGDVRFKVEITADELKAGGPVREEESTRILPAAGPPVVKEAKRSRVKR